MPWRVAIFLFACDVRPSTVAILRTIIHSFTEARESFSRFIVPQKAVVGGPRKSNGQEGKEEISVYCESKKAH